MAAVPAPIPPFPTTARYWPRLIAERTVDSLFAYEALRAVPAALITSPSNTRGQWDHALHLQRRTFLFECKAVISNRLRDPRATPWFSLIDQRQLDEYLRRGLDLTYLLVARPPLPANPWIRDCSIGACSSYDHCLACEEWFLFEQRRWAARISPLVAGAPEHMRLQPWFSHWAWCIRASDLRRFLDALPTPDFIPVLDNGLGSIPGATRLCHLLNAMGSDAPGGQGSASNGPTPNEEESLAPDFSVPSDALRGLLDMPAPHDEPDDDETTPPVLVRY